MLETEEEYKVIRDEFNTGPYPLVATARLCATFDALRAVARAAQAHKNREWEFRAKDVHFGLASWGQVLRALDALPAWVLDE